MGNADDTDGYVPSMLEVALLLGMVTVDSVMAVSAADGVTLKQAMLLQPDPATQKRSAMALDVMFGLARKGRTLVFISGNSFGRIEQGQAGSGGTEYGQFRESP